MPEFTANPNRFDPYKNFKFRLKWDGRYVAGVSKMTALKRTTPSRNSSSRVVRGWRSRFVTGLAGRLGQP